MVCKEGILKQLGIYLTGVSIRPANFMPRGCLGRPLVGCGVGIQAGNGREEEAGDLETCKLYDMNLASASGLG